MRIKELADRAGVSIDTVRFYERRGLIAEPPRRDSGYRIYSTAYVNRLRFIRRAQELGFTLREVEELLALRVSETTTCAEVRRQTRAKVADVERKIRDLESIRRALTVLAETCSGQGPLADCPILDALDHDALDADVPAQLPVL